MASYKTRLCAGILCFYWVFSCLFAIIMNSNVTFHHKFGGKSSHEESYYINIAFLRGDIVDCHPEETLSTEAEPRLTMLFEGWQSTMSLRKKLLFLFYYTECPISSTNFTALRHCRVTFKIVTWQIDQSDCWKLIWGLIKIFMPLNSGHLVLNINTGIVKFKLELKLTLSHPFKHKSAVIFNQSWQISENINEGYICM